MTGIEFSPEEGRWYAFVDYDLGRPNKDYDDVIGAYSNASQALKALLEALTARLQKETAALLGETQEQEKAVKAASSERDQAKKLWEMLGLNEPEGL